MAAKSRRAALEGAQTRARARALLALMLVEEPAAIIARRAVILAGDYEGAGGRRPARRCPTCHQLLGGHR